LPAVSGYRIESVPIELDSIAQARLDAADVGEVSIEIDLYRLMGQPAREVSEYRFRFESTRRELVRDQVARLTTEINSYLEGLTAIFPSDMEQVDDERWDLLTSAVHQIERLAGSQIPRTKAWPDLTRHLHFGQGQDLHAIARTDWPKIQADLRQNLYTELEPLPIEVADLGDLAKTKPEGPVTTEIPWADLSDEGFERLIFNLISDAEDYENPLWLTATSAPDRGRDLAAEHVRRDSLSGPTRERVVIQCRHWQKRSVGLPEVRVLLDQMTLWEPPAVHVLVVATSGRFTTDSIQWIEKHNGANERPRIDMWANTHLELLLASRPRLSATLHVR
jgi:hypothetical protein